MSRVASAEGASPTPLPGARAAEHDRQQRGAPGEHQRKRGCYDHQRPDAAPAGHDRHRRSPVLHVAHEPAADVLLKREPQPIRGDPSVLDGGGRDDERGGRSEPWPATRPAGAGRARPA